MTRSLVKVGDTLPVITRALSTGTGVFDFSSSAFPSSSQLVSAWDESDAVIYHRRDVTYIQATEGNPAGGVFAVPLWTGRGLVGARVSKVVGANDIVTVIFPAGPSGTVRQELYMSKAADPTGTLYRVAEGPDGFADTGGSGVALPVGSPGFSPAADVTVEWLTSPGDDTVLLGEAPSVDESITNGATAVLAGTTLTSAIVSSPGDGTLTTGTHEFAVLNLRNPDTATARIMRFEMIIRDLVTMRDHTRPGGAMEEIEVVEDIPAI